MMVMEEATTDEKRRWLEAFIVNNADLEELENRLAEFNIFEAIGAVRQELRHSDFLAFLLGPNQNHQLGDLFLKRFLKQALVGVSNPSINAVEIDAADLGNAEVFREWRRHGQEPNSLCETTPRNENGVLFRLVVSD